MTFDDDSVSGVNECDPENPGGFVAEDFQLVAAGVTGAAITCVEATAGGEYEVTATTGTGDGTLQLNLVDDDSITDQLGNKLGGEGTGPPPGNGDGSFFGVGAVYTIDRTAPTVQSIKRANASPTNAASVSWTVEFSESVSGVNTSRLRAVVSGLGGSPTITEVTPAGPASTYTVTAGTGPAKGRSA